jgi:hypothetical protein
MTRSDFARMIALAEEIGTDAAFEQIQNEATTDAYEADCDSRAAEHLEDRGYRYGCGEYDTVDSRARALRPTYNEAGEPYWM